MQENDSINLKLIYSAPETSEQEKSVKKESFIKAFKKFKTLYNEHQIEAEYGSNIKSNVKQFYDGPYKTGVFRYGKRSKETDQRRLLLVLALVATYIFFLTALAFEWVPSSKLTTTMSIIVLPIFLGVIIYEIVMFVRMQMAYKIFFNHYYMNICRKIADAQDMKFIIKPVKNTQTVKSANTRIVQKDIYNVNAGHNTAVISQMTVNGTTSVFSVTRVAVSEVEKYVDYFSGYQVAIKTQKSTKNDTKVLNAALFVGIRDNINVEKYNTSDLKNAYAPGLLQPAMLLCKNDVSLSAKEVAHINGFIRNFAGNIGRFAIYFYNDEVDLVFDKNGTYTHIDNTMFEKTDVGDTALCYAGVESIAKNIYVVDAAVRSLNFERMLEQKYLT